MTIKITKRMRELLSASLLGLSRAHPLGGWQVLTILYRDATSSEVPTTLSFLVTRYNTEYLDTAGGEEPMSDDVLKRILDVLADKARFVEVNSRRVRQRTRNGKLHRVQSYVYRITSAGIEYIKAMARVLETENTITANVNRIEEYCQLIEQLASGNGDEQTTALYNDFRRMLSAYEDVMKGMHKLDQDIDELASNIAFEHGGTAAAHLQKMLREQAIPAFQRMLEQSRRVLNLSGDPDFAERVARSQQGSDDLDAAHAVGDDVGMLVRFNNTRDYVHRQMRQIELSLDSSSSAIDASMDSVYQIFHTIMDSTHLLSSEFEHARQQSVDVQELSGELDDLLGSYLTLYVAEGLPEHVPYDRDVAEYTDLLHADTIGPRRYVAKMNEHNTKTMADNPSVVAGNAEADATVSALAEFKQLVMTDAHHGAVTQDLELTSRRTRDELVRLYPAIAYGEYSSFAPFGRAVSLVEASGDKPVRLHCRGEQFSVFLPTGLRLEFR